VRRLDKDEAEVRGILEGKVYIQTKLDGTNAVMGYDEATDTIWYGSRTRKLEGDLDNQGFKAKCKEDPRYEAFFKDHPEMILYGEWLVKHTISEYKSEAWNKFYVFDVCTMKSSEEIEYLSPDEYIPMMKQYCIDYIPVLAELTNPAEEDIRALLPEDDFLMLAEGQEEGCVIKNYNYKNCFNRITWAKIVTREFKEKANQPFKGESDGGIERKIVTDLLSKEFVDKEYAKILSENGGDFNPYMIPMTLGIVAHEFTEDNISLILKKYKRPTIDFKKLYREIETATKRFRDW